MFLKTPMKLFVSDQSVYFLQDKTLYKTQMDCYGFCDLDEGDVVMEDGDQMDRIVQMLVPLSELSQDAVQLSLF
jgi:hypothetical protein